MDWIGAITVVHAKSYASVHGLIMKRIGSRITCMGKTECLSVSGASKCLMVQSIVGFAQHVTQNIHVVKENRNARSRVEWLRER